MICNYNINYIIFSPIIIHFSLSLMSVIKYIFHLIKFSKYFKEQMPEQHHYRYLLNKWKMSMGIDIFYIKMRKPIFKKKRAVSYLSGLYSVCQSKNHECKIYRYVRHFPSVKNVQQTWPIARPFASGHLVTNHSVTCHLFTQCSHWSLATSLYSDHVVPLVLYRTTTWYI